MITPVPQKPNTTSATRSIEFLEQKGYTKHVRKYSCSLRFFFKASESENKLHWWIITYSHVIGGFERDLYLWVLKTWNLCWTIKTLQSPRLWTTMLCQWVKRHLDSQTTHLDSLFFFSLLDILNICTFLTFFTVIILVAGMVLVAYSENEDDSERL